MTFAKLVSLLLLNLTGFYAEDVIASKVFIIPVIPQTFDWHNAQGINEKFTYQASLLNSPDLPPWIHFTPASNREDKGFLYGVAPKGQGDFQLELIGLNKQSYETRYKVLNIKVSEKENHTTYEIHLKIDNLNVVDMFDDNRREALLDIFRKTLWKEATDLYVTFLASAVELGARLPVKPEEGEGVVIKLGSSYPFSQALIELQEEVKPLSKFVSCPRDFKKTTVERLFRVAGFILDWCSFKLNEENDGVHRESARRGPNVHVMGLPSSINSEHNEWRWTRPKKMEIPTRSYFKEIATAIFIPFVIFLILTMLLNASLCLHAEKSMDPESESYFHELFNVFLIRKEVTREKREPSPVEGLGNNGGVQMVQYATPGERGTLRSLSAQPSSPSGSLSPSPRISSERCNPYLRPNPPPYAGPNSLTNFRADF